MLLTLLLTLALQPPPTLYAHNVRTTLAHAIPDARTEYLVEDLRTHELLADTFANPAAPIPPGSLLKPFLAYAHTGPYPTVVCHGHASGCWRAAGHGRLTLTPALAQSCNAYFLALAATLTPAELARLTDLGLPAPPPDASAQTLIGLASPNPWLISPRNLAEAYARLIPLASPAILAGLRGSAQQGTAARVGPHPGGVLAKTGTAPCLDPTCQATGDGLTLALAPALHPTLLVLVRRRGTTGAVTAATAGRILTALDHLHAN